MFQTEIIIFIQSFANDFLTFIFRLFSALGQTEVIIPIIIGITTAIHFRKGFILMHISLWTGIITFFLKEFFALPRPANVDATVLLPGSGLSNPTPLQHMGAPGFFKALPSQAIDYCRAHPFDSFGFPSGHTSSAVALWGTLLLFFKKSWLSVLSIICLVAIPLSRLYLGRHFLADLAGGYFIGLFVLLIFYFGVYRQSAVYSYLFIKSWLIRWQWQTVILVFYFLVAPFLLLAIPFRSLATENGILLPALMLGANLGFLLLWRRGLPSEAGTVEQRGLRFILVIALFMLLRVMFKGVFSWLFGHESITLSFIRYTLTFFLTFGGGIELGIKFRLFIREKVNDEH